MPSWKLLLAGFCLMLSAAGQAGAEQTLRIGLADDPDILDPTLARTFTGRIVFAALCDKLVDISPELDIVPQLATEWQWVDDNKGLIMRLRQRVEFQDGEPLDAAAVKYSIERHLTLPGSTRKSEISAVTGVDIINDHTVKLVLSAPSASLLAQLTDRAGMIVSPKAAQAAGENFGAHPVCAGPFKFVERVAQDRIVLERFADYWDKDSIKIDRIVYLPIPELWVVLHHALRNALIPVVTLGALEFGQLLSRAVLTEQVFTIPGFGKLIVDAVFNRDYAVVQGVVLCTALAYILLNLLADIAYAVVNPRLRG